jgi:hypothetical protein
LDLPHYEKLGDRDEACAWLGRAMEGALRAGLFADAVGFGDRLAALAPDLTARANAVLATVHALVQGRQIEEAKARLDRREPGAHEVRWRILRLEVARARSEAAEEPELLTDADAAAPRPRPAPRRSSLPTPAAACPSSHPRLRTSLSQVSFKPARRER